MLTDGAHTVGEHHADVPPSLGAGVYVVRLHSAGRVASRTLTVVR